MYFNKTNQRANSFIEFEETRLDFAKFIFPYTFDIDNYEKLYPTFSFGNSKAELKNFIKSK
ncbi:MAG: DUF4476 domain-containing protein [Flavobacteriales bacterium]|nr:DUF4476 domain-containing protein [Flavobacteriales bacterium]